MNKLDNHVKEMKELGEFLISYNFPKSSVKMDEVLQPLKLRSFFVDGYEVVVYYTKADHDETYLEMVQIYGKRIPFLPFCLVCKIGRKFLGEEHLSFIEMMRDGKKIYFWVRVSDKEGNALPDKNKEKTCRYEGFKFGYIKAENVRFL